MFPCKSCCIAIFLAFLTINPDKFKVVSTKTVGVSSIWVEVGKMTELLLHCFRLGSMKSPERFMIILQDCLKRGSLLVFDRTLNRDVIDLAEGITLVRRQRQNGTRYNRALELAKNDSKFDEEEEDWKTQVVEKLAEYSQTHVLKIHLNLIKPLFEGRGRRKQNMFSQLLMFGIVAAGLIVIPMGFKFLAVLGGKALLLAKMALLLSAIQGLKKIATSNVNYGLYSTYGQGPCKDSSLGYDCNPLDNGDTVSISVDVEDLSQRHYDRQWPYDTESHGGSPYSYSYDNHPSDFLHPRRDIMEET